MTEKARLDLNIVISFPNAGVEFALAISDSDGSAEFSLTVHECESGALVPFTSAASPVLADWVRGYTRWLYRARVSATYTDDAIHGPLPANTNADSALESLRLACDMIRQRFELYKSTILVG